MARAAKKTAEAPVTKKTYILDLQNGNSRRVEVPSNWKLTFGPTIPYSGKGMGVPASQGGTALRFYEGNKENLRAVFTDVRALRDASMPIMEKRTETQRKVVQKHDQRGSRDVVVEARVTEWVNPDEDAEPGTPNPYLHNNSRLLSESADSDPFAPDF